MAGGLQATFEFLVAEYPEHRTQKPHPTVLVDGRIHSSNRPVGGIQFRFRYLARIAGSMAGDT